MKQKIVMKVQMNSDKCRSKALKIAAVTYGVSSVAIEGEEKDRLVVIGDGVDSASLTNLLRKKVGHTSLVSVEVVKKKQEPEKDKKPAPCPWTSGCSQYPGFRTYEVVYEPTPNSCSIM